MSMPFFLRLKRFAAKYDAPNHGYVVFDTGLTLFWTLFWTAWTRLHLRLMGCRVGRGFSANGRPWIRVARRGALQIGRGVTINSRFRANPVGLDRPAVIDCMGRGRITIGDGSGLSSPVLSSRASIVMGEHVLVGGNVRILDHDFHDLASPSGRGHDRGDGADSARPVVIGNDVFIGVNAVILKGTRLADRVVVGAGAVVAGLEAPPGSRVYGNPARVHVPGRPAAEAGPYLEGGTQA